MRIAVPKVDLTKIDTGWGWQETKEQVLMRCPNGHIADLTTHHIDLAGNVSPSVQCPKCSFHENITLEGF